MTMHALDALGSPFRRDILVALRHEPLSVGQLAGMFPVTRPAISRHLRVLEEAGLVELYEQGTKNIYALRAKGFRSAHEFLDSFWDAALDQMELIAREDALRAAGRPTGPR
ncbi:MAG: winged helix-turn-helix domain-containing protein [Polyangiaceae bacterium]